MKRNTIIFSLIILAIISLPACTNKADVDAELNGIWIYSTDFGGYMVGHGYSFEDGRFDEFRHIDYEVQSNMIDSGNYKINNKTITLNYDNKEKEPETLSFIFEKGVLELFRETSDGDTINYIKID